MDDDDGADLELLRALPRHAPPADLARKVRLVALERLAARPSLMDRLREGLALQLALGAVSAVYLVWAASHTPLLR